MIYVLIEHDVEGSYIFKAHTSKEAIMEKFYPERSVQVWLNGELIRTINSSDRFNNSLWLL